ncbi:hypothetical protein [Sphingobacterium sp.]|uniref:hypothetical protein n=1 Tax=Sphingobacterium sp. TaxID=341027 RepID=UPI0028AC05A0|nr:hypothetical protein [Sphingobacterium sp.]
MVLPSSFADQSIVIKELFLLQRIFLFIILAVSQVSKDGWPIGIDVYFIIGFNRFRLYFDKLYIVKEAINMVIGRQIA